MNSFAREVGANGNGKVTLLPSFFIIGPPRTGTTWLQNILSQCTWLSHPTKETRFFDKHFDRGLDWYRSHYRRANHGRMIGEVAPTYFSSVEARDRIARLIPDAKVVCTFRNPVDRVVSLYRLKRAYGLIPWSLDEALKRDPELMESSRYAAHLQAWKSVLGDSRVLATLHEDMQQDPQAYLDKVTDFLGLARLKLRPRQTRRVLSSEALTEPRCYYWTRGAILLAEWSRARRLDPLIASAKRWGAMKLFVGGGPSFPELSQYQQAGLRQLFRPEVEALEAILNRDFSAWK
jgi:ABC-type cobalamin/Fe3+-siderophores transport system ATPase subunit